MTDTSKQGISVIICCHNSKKRIGETLRHLAAQKMQAKTAWEVLLIDNASSDNTADFAQQIWAQLQPVHEMNFKIIREEALGLTNARLCGIRHAAFDLLLFCDDDNWLDENYVQNAVSIFAKNGDLGLAGTSAAIPVYETEPPQWLGAYTNLLACFSWDKTHITDTTHSEVSAAGCGMVIRRELALKYAAEIEHDQFRRALDRKGSNTISGGDTDINYAVIKYGFKIGVFSELKLQHFIPKERMTVKYIARLNYGINYSLQLIQHLYTTSFTEWSVKGRLLYLFRSFLKGPAYFEIVRSGFRGIRDGKQYLNALKTGNA